MYNFNYDCNEKKCCIEPGGITGSVQYNDGNHNFAGNNLFRYYDSGTSGAHGTFTVEAGHTAVTGINTLFNNELRIGKKLYINSTTSIGTIHSIVNDTTLFLTENAALSYTNKTFLTSNYNILQLDGDLLPSETNTYSLGNSEMYWKSLHVGPDTITLHNGTTQTANISLTNSDIIYLDTGSSVPYNIIGQDVTPTGNVNGWKLYTDGTPGTDTYDLLATEVNIIPGSPIISETYSFI
jgi:hypothetical protein